MNTFAEYQTIVLDCDGVILNSNNIKTQAFYQAAQSHGHDAAKALVDYHVNNGGISRYQKFEYFITEIIQKDFDDDLFQLLLNKFSQAVKKGLMECKVVDGLEEFRRYTSHANWLIVSGGDQNELRVVFEERGLLSLFDGGIYGSPDDKDQILSRELSLKNIGEKALFIGDSKYDFMAANAAGLDFIFVSDWTEVKDWKEFQLTHGFSAFDSITSLLKNTLPLPCRE